MTDGDGRGWRRWAQAGGEGELSSRRPERRRSSIGGEKEEGEEEGGESGRKRETTLLLSAEEQMDGGGQDELSRRLERGERDEQQIEATHGRDELMVATMVV
uniref:Uncharacterized protein n=1 Tax=Leersia perrieri TaxID=77586 RepID=A0A0D9WC86_9ORYZ